ncbi:MAG: hypothetical protein KAH31_00250 [Candidatus Sabulitectum sp.]|nr:hypothetical protein [Candidatus Sabulitectum sp.]
MNKIVVHGNDGSISKGYSSDFTPTVPYFHLATLEEPADSVKFWLENLKAVFIVMDFDGDPLHEDSHDFKKAPFFGRHIVVTFKDGEKFYGISELSHRDSTGFYIFPGDTDSNTIRAFVLRSAIASVDIAN